MLMSKRKGKEGRVRRGRERRREEREKMAQI